MRYISWNWLATLLLLSQCALFKSTPEQETVTEVGAEVPSVETDTYRTPGHYRAAATHINDLLHTRLDVQFDWEQQYLLGEAWLTFTPYFYPTDSLTLDAKGFDLHEVVLLQGTEKQPLDYTYDSLKLSVDLPRTYTRTDTYQLYIDYTAKPNELDAEGSAAIRSAKGLYFINPLGKDEHKPRQLWTQGETEASSCWFPTIDVPNERTSQELFITVDTGFVSLSNGILEYSNLNGDGTRTDYWKQDLTHPPYLFMMAVGKYAIVKDEWDGMEVSYYVEPKYEPYARDIFGHTPEMLEYFSELLGYRYPWDKYAQVVVRDFVAGAMENTSASVFMEGLQLTERELLDRHWDGIIAHELFHHWFGDLVTCESWSNLPLNEAFANYSQLLWDEYKYGSETAEYENYSEMQGYLREAENKQEPLIRFYYENKTDMFDAHSYNKGGRVLHMLRHVVGDDAFFKGLKQYLHEHAFQPAEVHHLRLAFEAVTGQDMNWFFNQWFLSPGHPLLEIDYAYDEASGHAYVYLKQKPSTEEAGLFRLPLAVDVYRNGTATRHHAVFHASHDTLVFKTAGRPDLINVDAAKVLLCEKTDNKSTTAYLYQYRHAPLLMDRMEAVEHFAGVQHRNDTVRQVLLDVLGDPFWALRSQAVRNIDLDDSTLAEKALPVLVELARTDTHTAVRARALQRLSKYDAGRYEALFAEMSEARSFRVLSAALEALAKSDPEKALARAGKLEAEDNDNLRLTIAEIYSEHGGEQHHAFFTESFDRISGYHRFFFMDVYAEYLLHMDNDAFFETALEQFEAAYEKGSGRYLSMFMMRVVSDIRSRYDTKISELEAEIEDASMENAQKQQQLQAYQAMEVRWSDLLESLQDEAGITIRAN